MGECNMKIGLLEKKLETADAEVALPGTNTTITPSHPSFSLSSSSSSSSSLFSFSSSVCQEGRGAKTGDRACEKCHGAAGTVGKKMLFFVSVVTDCLCVLQEVQQGYGGVAGRH